MQRDATLFNSPAGGGEVDKLANAINMSKNWAQRMRDFESAKVQVDVPVQKTVGGPLSGAVLSSDGVTSVRVKKIDRGFVPSTDGGKYPVDLISREEQVRRVQRIVEEYCPEDRTSNSIPSPYVTFSIVQQGQTIFLHPWSDALFASGSATLILDVVQWMPDYSGPTDEDFFLIEGLDWMLLKTISYLNLFLKDDNRIIVPAAMVKEAWESFVAWDESAVGATTPINLD